jgi:effector-binding domain-containing protein
VEHHVELKQVPATPLLVVRRRAVRSQLSTMVPEACGEVWKFVRASGIRSAGRHVAVYLNDRIDLEVGVEVGSDATGSDKVVLSGTPAGTVATTTHFGPYGQLGQAHDALQHWCAANHHRLAGPCWEVYGHWQSDWDHDPSKIRTEVFYLLTV